MTQHTLKHMIMNKISPYKIVLTKCKTNPSTTTMKTALSITTSSMSILTTRIKLNRTCFKIIKVFRMPTYSRICSSAWTWYRKIKQLTCWHRCFKSSTSIIRRRISWAPIIIIRHRRISWISQIIQSWVPLEEGCLERAELGIEELAIKTSTHPNNIRDGARPKRAPIRSIIRLISWCLAVSIRQTRLLTSLAVQTISIRPNQRLRRTTFTFSDTVDPVVLLIGFWTRPSKAPSLQQIIKITPTKPTLPTKIASNKLSLSSRCSSQVATCSMRLLRRRHLWPIRATCRRSKLSNRRHAHEWEALTKGQASLQR